MTQTRRLLALSGFTLVVGASGAAMDARAASDVGDAPPAPTPVTTCDVKRPTVLFNRWQEDWSVLANPCVPREPLDGLKYMPLGGDPASYLSLGANLRERLEVNDAALFGVGANHADTYLLQRAEVHADIHLGDHLQIFTQIEDAQPYGKDSVTPVDKNPLDLEQAFITYVRALGGGTFKFRLGRQEMAFDLQRFISVRDGPNVRQAFDGLWTDWEIQRWRFIAYATQPVQNRDVSNFDDVSNRHLTFSGVRFERQGVGPGDLSGYYSRYNRDNAHFLDATGNEHRDVFDLRYTGKAGHVDWDVETMLQSGHVGAQTIRAWALGTVAGYTFAQSAWKLRAGLQFDAASGDHHPGDGRIGTFNPLFPNGYYFTLAGDTGYNNLIHLKPTLTIKPAAGLTLMGALGLQWRETTADAVYAQGSAAVAGTAGKGDRWTGVYAQLRADWAINRNLSASLEAVHFQVGDTLRQAGGANADYIGAELKFGW